MTRPCDGCTLCCKFLGVEELGKPAASWCAHCSVGNGCVVYRNRPRTCAEFQCVWTLDADMPDELRPDRCGAVLVETKDRRVVLVLTERDDVLDRGALRRWAVVARARGISVVVVDPRRFPHGDQEIRLGGGRELRDVRASLQSGLAMLSAGGRDGAFVR